MAKRIALLVSGLVLGLAGAAPAHLISHSDPDDSRGNLDIRSVELDQSFRSNTRFVTTTFRTYDRFGQRDLMNSGFQVDLDSRGDQGRDFYLTIGLYEDGTPICSIYNDQGFAAGGGELEFGARSVSCEFVKGRIRPTKHIRWRASSQESFGQYEDRVPERGWFGH